MPVKRRRTLFACFVEENETIVQIICMKELLELFTMTINHLCKIYLGKIAQCLSIIEIFAHLQLEFKKLRITLRIIYQN